MSFGGKLLRKCFSWYSFGWLDAAAAYAAFDADAAVELLDVVGCMDATPCCSAVHTVHLLLSATIFPSCTYVRRHIYVRRVGGCEIKPIYNIILCVVHGTKERRYVSEIGKRMERGTSVAGEEDICHADGMCAGELLIPKHCRRYWETLQDWVTYR